MLSHRTRALTLAIVVALCAGISSSQVSAETLRIGGTGAATEMLMRLGALFSATSKIELEVIPGLGSSGGIRAAIDGALDITVSGRRLTPDEKAKGLAETGVLKTPFVIVTSLLKPAGMTSAEIVQAFGSERKTWPDGSVIHVILRPKSDSDTTLLGELFPNMAAAIETSRKRSDIPTAATDQDNINIAEQVPGSLTAATLLQILSERKNLRLIAIDGVEPSFTNFESGKYKYVKELLFIVRARKNQAIEQFLAFLRSPEAQKSIREVGGRMIVN
jgi:phosphate transport system substrate-binding protein